MHQHPRSTTLSVLALAVALSACAASPAQAPPIVPIAAPPAEAPAPPREPPLTLEAARSLAVAWKAAWHELPASPDGSGPAREKFYATNGIDEPTVRRVLEALTRDCLAQRSSEAAPCQQLGATARNDDPTDSVFEIAGEVLDILPGGSELMRLLVRLDARGAWRADMAIERSLERRMIAARDACTPPTWDELDAARADLANVRVRTAGGGARPARAEELSDLAYLRVALTQAGPEVGTAKEDDASPALAEGSADLARRETMRDAMRDALLDGDVARHAQAAKVYLEALGYPGPIRVAEETDRRWGGMGFSYAMRLWARSAEILGQYDVAESLHRRAAPGGGMCGTSTPHVLAEQMEGAIRSAELREGCRPIVAERLHVPGGGSGTYGPARLQRVGFDVIRLYRAALIETTDGPDWATRTRALAGYADVAGREAVPRLVDIAEHGATDHRVEALRALQGALRSSGLDPCKPSRLGYGHSTRSGQRQVASIMTKCDRKLDDAALSHTIQRIAALASDPDWRVREAVAKTLGVTASPRARAALEKLARDQHDEGGRVCTVIDGGPEQCEPNQPVKRAAREGLVDLAEAEEVRRSQTADLRAPK
jgi:hypothetical protein